MKFPVKANSESPYDFSKARMTCICDRIIHSCPVTVNRLLQIEKNHLLYPLPEGIRLIPDLLRCRIRDADDLFRALLRKFFRRKPTLVRGTHHDIEVFRKVYTQSSYHSVDPLNCLGAVTVIRTPLFSDPVHEFPQSGQFPSGYVASSSGVSTALPQLAQ